MQPLSLHFSSSSLQLCLSVTVSGRLQKDTSVSWTNACNSGFSDDSGAATLDSSTGAVVLQTGMVIATIHAGGGGEALRDRTWQGLDPSLPPPVVVGEVVEGRKGVASMYQDEVSS